MALGATQVSPQLAVYGAGAIGSQLGGRVHAAGYNVTLIEPWEPQRSAIQRDGITVHDSGTETHYRPPVLAPSELPHLPGSIDILFLAVKSYDTLDALAVTQAYLAPDCLVVSMQNSINEEWIAPIIGGERVLGGVILINGVLLEPGHVTATPSVSQASASADLPGVYVGSYAAPAGERVIEVASIVDAAWPAVAIDDLLHERWSKMVINTMINSVSGVSGLPSAEALAHPEARFVQIALAAEVLRVAEAEGHPVEVIMGDYSAQDMYDGALGKSEVVSKGLGQRAALVGPEAKTSLLQDVLRGRRTESDYFAGLVAHKGRQHGLETPYCSAVTELMHQIEGGLLSPSPETLSEVRRLVEA
jgi:2-dehydropantoate 2-reductase